MLICDRREIFGRNLWLSLILSWELFFEARFSLLSELFKPNASAASHAAVVFALGGNVTNAIIKFAAFLYTGMQFSSFGVGAAIHLLKAEVFNYV